MKNSLQGFMTRPSSPPSLARAAFVPCIIAGLVALGGCASGADTSARSDVMTAEQQRAMTPAQVLTQLEAGNQRFAAGKGTPMDYTTQVRRTAEGQFPKAVVLSCLDSRIPPEVIFDRGIGDLYVARVAGNFENTDILGSMEFATAAAGAKAIVVLGHNNCGAVKGAIDDVKLGNLTETLANITPSVQTTRAAMPGAAGSKDSAFVQAVAVENVRRTISDIPARSPVLADRVAKGELVIVGGMYDLNTGKVEWLDR
jgi:carbonic anhydrase